MFLLRDGTDSSLYYVSTDGMLSPASITARHFFISPERKHLIAWNDRTMGIYTAGGDHVRDVSLPFESAAYEYPSITWLPDSSGLFLWHKDSQSDLEALYSMGLAAGEPVPVENRLITFWVDNPFWLYP
jgi:hypothetical protein